MKIFLLGFMGAGKSFWGKQLADQYHLPFYDLDEVIVQDEEMAVSDIFATKGEEYFRRKESNLLRELSKQDKFLISCGGGTPCLQENIDLMNERGTTIWIHPSIQVMTERLLRKKSKRPLIADMPDEEVPDFIEMKLSERRPFYEQAQIIIDQDDISLDTFAEKLANA
ncbi:shikimate kinase [Chitinophaga parva]|uniref:Shikimate kinase n=1 Tax=Chitinophaga parva TaxID=2169414 RepID=A0A2T7BBC9_9BACT|nr:shikimate kinase [Chitinophaga parva]PUZ21683.1 shikimate kinase [Chitinophaga parva]